MYRLIVIILLALAVYMVWQRYRAKTAAQQKKMRSNFIIALVVIVVLGLTLSGRLNWLFAAATGALAALPRLISLASRYWPFIRGLLQVRANAAMAHSKMQAAFLLLVMDRRSGALSGEVLQGQFQGRQLASLSQQECLQLLKECQQDAQSVSLLAAYMDATFPQWRQAYQGDTGQQSAQAGASMSKQEAAEVLGVPQDADKKTIATAHKRLMQRLHPDRGGSDYLAAKINQAKDVLLS